MKHTHTQPCRLSESHTLNAETKNYFCFSYKLRYQFHVFHISAILCFASSFVFMCVLCVCILLRLCASHSLSFVDPPSSSMCSDMVRLCGLFLRGKSLVKYGQNASRSMGSSPASFPPRRALSESAKQSPPRPDADSTGGSRQY